MTVSLHWRGALSGYGAACTSGGRPNVGALPCTHCTILSFHARAVSTSDSIRATPLKNKCCSPPTCIELTQSRTARAAAAKRSLDRGARQAARVIRISAAPYSSTTSRSPVAAGTTRDGSPLCRASMFAAVASYWCTMGGSSSPQNAIPYTIPGRLYALMSAAAIAGGSAVTLLVARMARRRPHFAATWSRCVVYCTVPAPLGAGPAASRNDSSNQTPRNL
jgi:hypothetical protein